MPVEAFIRRLIRDKSLFAYIRALGDGQQRQENVETFLSIAGRFDQNGGLGLAAFLRYVDSMIRGDGKTDSAPGDRYRRERSQNYECAPLQGAGIPGVHFSRRPGASTICRI